VRVRSRDSLWFGLSCLGLAAVIAICGYVTRSWSFVRTTGKITHSLGVPGGYTSRDSQFITYTYSVSDVVYTGRGTARLHGVPDSAREVGGTIAVYYDRDSPARSMPQAPPAPWGWVGGTVIFTIFGLAGVISAWRQ
jgi:hypothetical protein